MIASVALVAMVQRVNKANMKLQRVSHSRKESAGLYHKALCEIWNDVYVNKIEPSRINPVEYSIKYHIRAIRSNAVKQVLQLNTPPTFEQTERFRKEQYRPINLDVKELDLEPTKNVEFIDLTQIEDAFLNYGKATAFWCIEERFKELKHRFKTDPKDAGLSAKMEELAEYFYFLARKWNTNQ